MRGLKTKDDAVVAIPVESHTEPDKLFNRSGRRGEDRSGDLAVAKAVAGGQGIRQMQRDFVVRPDAGGNAALREHAR